MPVPFDTRFAERFASLSPRLREAGEFIAANPVDTATRGLRTIAAEARLAPATFTRLAHALGYAGFEELREAMRERLGRDMRRFSSRADALRHEPQDTAAALLSRYAAACTANIESLAASLDADTLETVAARLGTARRVVLLGALGSLGPATYGAYMGRFLGPGWELAGAGGASLGNALADIGPEDALLVITKPPSARSTIRATEAAARRGAYVIVLTDSLACPALPWADTHFIAPDDTPNFFSSYVATLFLLETLVAITARAAGPDVTDRIARIEAQSRLLEEVVDS